MSDNENSNLQGAFGAKSDKKAHVDYSHPQNEAFWKQIKEDLWQFPIGRSLVRVTQVYDNHFKILKGKAEPGFFTETNTAYIFAPLKQDTVLPKQILDAAKALRLAEQEILGLTTPDPSKDMFEHASIVHTKNLDSIVYMCKVVEERKGHESFDVLLDTLKEMGHSMIYKAYVDGKSQKEVFDTYAEN